MSHTQDMNSQPDSLLPELKYSNCPCAGRNLDKLLQPAMLALLAQEDMHGYLIVQRLAEMSMFGGQKPDATGVYRFLKQMEERSMISYTWDLSETGPAKRLYTITDAGRACLARWSDTLAEYRDAIGLLLDFTRAAQS